jgi:hypothetical protein
VVEKFLSPSQQFHRLVERLRSVVERPAGNHLLDELFIPWRKIDTHDALSIP